MPAVARGRDTSVFHPPNFAEQKIQQLHNHLSDRDDSWTKKKARRGARTHNLEIKSLTRYRLCQPGLLLLDGRRGGLHEYISKLSIPAY